MLCPSKYRRPISMPSRSGNRATRLSRCSFSILTCVEASSPFSWRWSLSGRAAGTRRALNSFDHLAASDLHQPRPELAFVVERLQPAKGHQQCRLDDILGLVNVARFRESDRQQDAFISLGQLAECFYVAKPYAGHKLRIGYQSRSLPLSAQNHHSSIDGCGQRFAARNASELQNTAGSDELGSLTFRRFFQTACEKMASGQSQDEIRAEMMILADTPDLPFASMIRQACEDALSGRPRDFPHRASLPSVLAEPTPLLAETE